MLHVDVSLLSGKRKQLAISESSKVGDLKVLVQQSFEQPFLRLLTAAGHPLTNPEESLQSAGVREGEQLTAIAQQAKVASTHGAFAMWCPGGDRVVTWGNSNHGGDASKKLGTTSEVRNVQKIVGTKLCNMLTGSAFAAIREDGSVVTWGHSACGGDSSAVQEQLRNVQEVEGTGGAFAAILKDGSVVTWGLANLGGDSSAVQDQLQHVRQVVGTGGAFAAVLEDGSVTTWGNPKFGGDSSAVQERLKNVQDVVGNSMAFAAILTNGSVISWGEDFFDVPEVSCLKVQQIVGTSGAFAAIVEDRSVVTWGRPTEGGDSSAVRDQLQKVRQVVGTAGAFAAVLEDGSVITWGQERFGSESSLVSDRLKKVQRIVGTNIDGTRFGNMLISKGGFAAILEDGSVVTWGHREGGGDSSSVQDQLRNVQQVVGTTEAFTAVLQDGSLVTWGNQHRGGYCNVQEQLPYL